MIARLGAGLARLLGIDTADVVTHDERRQQVRTVVAIALPVGLAFTFYNFVQGFTMLALVEGAACLLLIVAAVTAVGRAAVSRATASARSLPCTISLPIMLS